MDDELTILWTNADPITSHHMVMMYATNAKLNKWFDEVKVVLWGTPQKYVSEDKKIQERIKIAKQAGVKFSACISCSNNIVKTKELNALGIETIRWGERLSDLMKDGKPLLTI
jgi:hypothetical protein